MLYFCLILTIFCTQLYSFNYCLDLPEDIHLNIYKYLKHELKPPQNNFFYINKKIYNLYLGFYKRDLYLFSYKIISDLDTCLAQKSLDYLIKILSDNNFSYNQSYFFIKNFLNQTISDLVDLFNFNFEEVTSLNYLKDFVEQMTLSKLFIVFYGIETDIDIKDTKIKTILLIKNKELYLKYLDNMFFDEKIDGDITIYRTNIKIPLYNILFAIVVGVKDFRFIKSVFLHDYKIKNKPKNYALSIFHTLICLHLQCPLKDDLKEDLDLQSLSPESLRIKLHTIKTETLINNPELQKYILDILKLMKLLGFKMGRRTKQILIEYFENIDNIIIEIDGFIENE